MPCVNLPSCLHLTMPCRVGPATPRVWLWVGAWLTQHQLVSGGVGWENSYVGNLTPSWWSPSKNSWRLNQHLTGNAVWTATQSQSKGTRLVHYCSSAMPGLAVLHLPHALVTQLTFHVITTTSITAVSENVSWSGQSLTLRVVRG